MPAAPAELVPVPLRLAVAPELEIGALEARELLLDSAPVPVLVDAPVVPLTPDVPVLDDAPLTPEHGATAAEVSEVELVEEISTPATLQFSGICCSMISTKLIGPVALVPVVDVVVRVLVVPAAPLEAPVAPEDAPVAGTDAPVAPADAPVPIAEELAPTAGDALEVVDVVVLVDVAVVGAVRMSMNATVWPLLLRFMKVPSIGICELLEPVVLVVDAPLVPAALDVPVAPEAPLVPVPVANVPLHWF